MPTFSAADIVGKTLIAKKPVALKRLPKKTAPTVYTVPVGAAVGTVYSWVQEDKIGPLWWMFYDQNENPYYAQQESGKFDFEVLEAQGVISLEQVQEDQNKANNPVGFYVDKVFKLAALGLGIWIAGQLFIDFQKSKK